MPTKEIHFFDRAENYSKGFDWYESFFQECGKSKLVGEATPDYFYTRPEDSRPGLCPPMIHDYVPDAKFIVLFREPVDRAISAYYHHIQKGRISPVWPLKNAMYQANILSMGFYDEHIDNWLEYFDRDRFLFLFFETNVVTNKDETLRSVFDFLDIDSFTPSYDLQKKKNARRSHFFMRMRHIYPKALQYVNYFDHLPTVVRNYIERIAHISVTDKEKRALTRQYASHVQRLQENYDLTLPDSWVALHSSHTSNKEVHVPTTD